MKLDVWPLQLAVAVLMLLLGAREAGAPLRLPGGQGRIGAQLLLLLGAIPLAVGWAGARLELEPPLVAGLLALAAAPSGPLSAAYTRLVSGDVPVALQLVVVGTLLAPLAGLAVAWHVAGGALGLGAQVEVVVVVVLSIAAPVLLGRGLAGRWPGLGRRLGAAFRPMTVLVLVGAVVFTLASASVRELAVTMPRVVVACLALNGLNLVVGVVAGGLRVGPGLSFAVRNGTMALALVSTPAFLEGRVTAVACVVTYAAVQSLSTAAIVGLARRRGG